MSQVLPGPPATPSVFVALLHFEGDAFNDSLVQANERGGRDAAHELHRVLRAEGGAATEELLSRYLPLPTTALIFLASLHTNYLATYLSGLPSNLRAKIVLLDTVTIAPKIRRLVDEGLFKVSQAAKGLFGDLGGATSGLALLALDELDERKDETPRFNDFSSSSTGYSYPDASSSNRLLWGSPPSPPPRSPPPAQFWSPSSAPPSPLWQPDPFFQNDATPPTSPAASPSKSGSHRKRSGRERDEARKGKNGKERQKTEGDKVPPNLFPPAYAPPPMGTAFKPPHLTLPADVRPCNRYYLDPAGCHDKRCSYSHDYPFAPEEWRVYALYIRGSVCPNLRGGASGRCGKGDECPFGHVCPYTQKQCPFDERCHFLRAGLGHSKRA
ncbi:hypothetical protein JCM6882_000736 [Rhodosporidiobolus microsporus]